MKESAAYSYLSSGEEYIDYLYECYLENPESVSADWQKYFDAFGKNDVSHAQIREKFLALSKQHTPVMVDDKDRLYRKSGHLYAHLDPLDLMPREEAPTVNPTLKQTYCSTIGAEFMHINNENEIQWIQNYLEHKNFREKISAEKQKRILKCLTAAEGLEKYLGSKYVGQKRFSLEGGDSLIVLLEELIQHGGKNNIKEMVVGMAHRGRLNVLVNILGKSPQDLFNEFEGKNHDKNYSGDVKYHMGFSSDIKINGEYVHLALAFNPSHLEIVSPVAIGSVRARQQRRGLDKHQEVLGIQIHGDAAFAGQGVVMETFTLSQTKGYGTGGTVHIVVNNQVGFTADPDETRSTRYCTDIAKMIEAPIFHVNGDDPEAVFFLAQLAIDYRNTFAKDIVIDLICYRRHGHNEADEPSATQPVMYKKIRALPTIRKIYADKLINNNIITEEESNTFIDAYRDALDRGENPHAPTLKGIKNPYGVDWSPYVDQTLNQPVNTAVKLDILKKLGTHINTLPEGMVLQPQVAKIIDDNRKMAKGEAPINWGFAENLAYATLLNENFSVRISGQDSGRGTFAHRHAVLHDYQNGKTFTPLQTVSDKANFMVIDSVLSEEAVMAFEYGYSTATPESLILWEAQFGDFANGAQVVIDQFISSGEQKWKRLSGLVLLLPHGYEGMGPEHSSARLERYLQLCAQENMQVCVPTTPAQIFHLLRRQVLQKARKPLIVMTPKSLLRHKLAVSTLEELAKGGFQPIIDDPVKNATRAIFCSGKIYYELLEAREKEKIKDVALIRLEQLYPFPEIKNKNFKDIIWCQEEPQNQGAWNFVRDYLPEARYVGRKAAASPAVGSAKLHVKEQQQIIIDALKGK